MTSVITSEKGTLIPEDYDSSSFVSDDSPTDILRQTGHCTVRQRVQFLGSWPFRRLRCLLQNGYSFQPRLYHEDSVVTSIIRIFFHLSIPFLKFFHFPRRLSQMPSGSTVLPSCASPKSAKAYRQSRYPRNRYCRSKLLFQKSNDLHTKRFTPVLWKNGMSGVKDVKEGKVVNKLLGLLPRISSPVIWKETHHESLSWRVIEKRRSRQDGQLIF